MNFQIRTNQSLHISQLIAPALLPFNVHDGKHNFPPADGTILQTASHKTGEVGPVRPAERVPQSSPTNQSRTRTAISEASACAEQPDDKNGSSGTGLDVAA